MAHSVMGDMMSKQHQLYIRHTLRRRFAASVHFVQRSVLDPIVHGHRRRRTARALSSLDDVLLDDIGLSRGEITRVVDDMLRHRAETTAPSPTGLTTPSDDMVRRFRKAA